MSDSTLIAKVKELAKFPDEGESRRIISGLKFDMLCAQLEKLLAYGPGVPEFIILQQRIVVECADSAQDTLTSTLDAYGDPVPRPWRATSTCRAGMPSSWCSMAVSAHPASSRHTQRRSVTLSARSWKRTDWAWSRRCGELRRCVKSLVWVYYRV